MKLNPQVKQIALLVVSVLIIFIVAYLLLADREQIDRSARYVCEDGNQIELVQDGRDLTLYLPDTGAVEVSELVAERRITYTNSDETVSLRDQDNEAVLKVDGKIIYDSCIKQKSSRAEFGLGNPTDWSVYDSGRLSNGYGFSIAYPPITTIDDEIDNQTSFEFKGPRNTRGDLTDGFTFDVEIKDSPQSLEAINALATGEADELLFGGNSAYSLVVQDDESGLSQQILIVNLADNAQAMISYEILGNSTTKPRYQQAVGEMLNSLVFNPDQPEQTIGDEKAFTNQISVALINPAVNPGDKCSDTTLIKKFIAPSTNPLDRSLEILFSLRDTEIEPSVNFIPKTAKTLKYDRSTIAGTTANVYLSGRLSGVESACQNNQAQAQIVETARSVDEIEKIQLFLNNNPIDSLFESEGLQG